MLDEMGTNESDVVNTKTAKVNVRIPHELYAGFPLDETNTQYLLRCVRLEQSQRFGTLVDNAPAMTKADKERKAEAAEAVDAMLKRSEEAAAKLAARAEKRARTVGMDAKAEALARNIARRELQSKLREEARLAAEKKAEALRDKRLALEREIEEAEREVAQEGKAAKREAELAKRDADKVAAMQTAEAKRKDAAEKKAREAKERQERADARAAARKAKAEAKAASAPQRAAAKANAPRTADGRRLGSNGKPLGRPRKSSLVVEVAEGVKVAEEAPAPVKRGRKPAAAVVAPPVVEEAPKPAKRRPVKSEQQVKEAAIMDEKPRRRPTGVKTAKAPAVTKPPESPNVKTTRRRVKKEAA